MGSGTPGSNDQLPPVNADDLFVSIGSGTENLHLEQSGHNARNTGLDLSGTFTGDIDGESRSAPWDIGADEWSEGSGSQPRIISWREVEP